MKRAKLKKILIVLCIFLIVILGTAGLLWYGLNYYFIPKIIIPQIKNKIATFNRDNMVNLKIQEICFLPLRGFQLKGIELSPIIAAKEVDIDLDYFALLSRKIHLPQINITGADLNVKRSKQGKWNYEPAIKSIFGKEKKDRPSFIDIDQINISRGQVYFDDQLFSDNRLTKHFKDVTIKIKSPDRENYYVEASGADVKRQDAIRFMFNYSTKTALIKGKAQLKIADLADYRDYYLDELILPWHLAKARVKAQAEFTYCKGNFSIDGDYEIKNGQINYGDIKLAGDGFIDHKQKYVKGKKEQNILSAQAKIDNLSLLFEKNAVLEKGKCEAVITGKKIQIKKLQGLSQGKPVDLKGQFVFQPMRRLDLAGKIGVADNVFHLKLLSDNAAQADWLSSAEASHVKVYANFSDIKKLRFSGNVSGHVDLGLLPGKVWINADERHVTVSFEAAKKELKGTMGFSGKLQGVLNKPETLSGKLGLKFDDFSLLGLEPLSFLLGMKVEQGVFASAIPPMDLYRGKLSGAVALDTKHWGIELNIEDMDLAKFTGVNPQLAGLEGLFTGKIAAVGNWGEQNSIRGGGSFSLTDADLKSAPIFSTAQQGVGSVVKDFQMPDFKAVKGNFDITSEVVTFNNALASAPDMELRGSGTIDFSRRADFTLGVKFIQKRDFKTAMYIFFPLPTLGFDLLSKAIKVEIKGVIPDLKQTTTVQTLGWLTDAYGQQSSFDPDQYTLEKLWQKGN